VAGGIGAVATPTEGGGGCNCSRKKKVKAYFHLFTFLGVGGVKPEDINVEVACGGPEAEWVCCCGGEIEEKEEWATSQTGQKVEKE
jgi:hypothetical protein